MRDYFVYHIKLEGMNLEEGYIGITNSLSRRWDEHCRARSRVGNHIRRSKGQAFMVELSHCTKDDALAEEKRLRPYYHIGWNVLPGGLMIPDKYIKGKRKFRFEYVDEDVEDIIEWHPRRKNVYLQR